jgi:hypothetical protein
MKFSLEFFIAFDSTIGYYRTIFACGDLRIRIWDDVSFPMDSPAAYNKEHYPNGLNADFYKPAHELKSVFTGELGKFECENRPIAKMAKEIANELGDIQGSRLVDFGAGSGLFAQLFAQKIGPAGQLFPRSPFR